MTGFDDDRELDDFLARRSALHRRLADVDHTEPPPELDRLVLDEARQAIDVPGSTPVYRAPRWALPVSLAATVVLALAIIVSLERAQRGAYPVAASATPAADAANAEADAKPLQKAPAPSAIGPGARVAASGAASFAAEPPPAPAAATEVPPQEPAVAVRMPAAVHAASDAKAIGAPGSPRLAANGSARFARVQANAPRAIVPAKREMAFHTTEFENAEASAERRARTDLVSATAGVTGTTIEATRAASNAPAVAPMPSDEVKRADPRAWLREIERLRASGKGAEADRELAEFRKAFPGEAVPAAARDPRPAR